ncbi:MAG: hypothetical protein ACI9N1_002743 [Flavobacteriales bacterium]|jgi:hypothetical protein
MKFILSIFFLLANFIGNSQDLAEGVYDSVKVFPSSNIKLAYKGNITAVYWEKTLLFQPSKNFYYYFEEKGFLGEVDYDTKEIFFTFFNKETGDFEKYKKDKDLNFLESNPCDGSSNYTGLREINKARDSYLQGRNYNNNIEVFEDKIYVKNVISKYNSYSKSWGTKYKSKIFDMSSNDWTIKEGIKSVQEINEYLIVGFLDSSKFYYVYELFNGQPLNKISTIKGEKPEIYQDIFNVDSISSFDEEIRKITTYNIFKDQKVGMIESHLYEYATWPGEITLLVPTEFNFVIPLLYFGCYLVQQNDSLILYDRFSRNELKFNQDSISRPLNSIFSVNFPNEYGHQDEKTYYFKITEINDSLLLIIDSRLEQMTNALDKEGNDLYDDDGFGISIFDKGKYRSGLYNKFTKKWIVSNTYYETYYLNDFIIVVSPEFEEYDEYEEFGKSEEYGEFRTGLYQYDIFDLNGNLILKNVREGDTSVLELFYPESKVTSLGNNEYYIEQDGIYHWIEFSFSNGELFKDLELKRSNTEWVHKVRHQSTEPFDPKEVKIP